MNVQTQLIDEVAAAVRAGMPLYVDSVYAGRLEGWSVADMPAIAVDCVGFTVREVPGGIRPCVQDRTYKVQVTILGVLDGDIDRLLQAHAVELEGVLLDPFSTIKVKTWRLREAGTDAMASAKSDEGKIAGYTLFYDAVIATREGDPSKSLVKGY